MSDQDYILRNKKLYVNEIESETTSITISSGDASGSIIFSPGQSVDFTGTTVVALAVGGGGAFVTRTTVNAATYNVQSTDYLIHSTYSTTGTSQVTLPALQANRYIIIKDAAGNAEANPITIQTPGAETIDGSATLSLAAKYASFALYCDGSNWFVV